MLIMSAERKRSLSSCALAVTLIALATICQSKPAISISDQHQEPQQQQQVASESQPPTTSPSSQPPPPPPPLHPSAPSLPTSTAQAQAGSGAAEASGRARRPGSSAHHQQQQQHNGTGNRQSGGRARKPTTPRHHSHNHGQHHHHLHQQQQEATATATTTTAPPEPTTPPDDAHSQLPEAIRLMRNTPPLFVTSTRDFFVDVARFPLGHKLTTIQAVDSEGDRLEYALRPARVRDASPYFAINATSGELRLANSRMPDPDAMSVELGGEGDGDESRAADSLAAEEADPEEGALLDRSAGFLYHLNVEANDGHYPSVLELQIHVFNSTSLGTKSPVQLTIEGGRRGAESLMRAKTDEFFRKLYGEPVRASVARGREPNRPGNSSSIVVPSFVNPTLVASDREIEQQQQQEAGAEGARQRPVHVAGTADGASPASGATTRPRMEQQQQPLRPLASNLIEGTGELAPPAHSDMQSLAIEQHQHQQRQQQQQLVMQQPVVVSLIVMIGACLAIVFVLLVFVVPLSVKRLKRRLKNMELQHEQLSQKTSSNISGGGGGGSSLISGGCSASLAASSSGSTMATSGHSRAHLPSLSQFTLASGTSGSVLNHNHSNHHHHHQLLQHAHLQLSPDGYNLQPRDRALRTALGRQSSLDSALTPSDNYRDGADNHSPPNYNYNPNMSLNPRGPDTQHDEQQHYHHHHHHHQQQYPASLATQNGHMLLNRINNGAIVNPVYLHQIGAGGASQLAESAGNIYCPIDDDHYSQISTAEAPPGRCAAGHELAPGMASVGSGQVGSLVGQTCDSRAYFASGCARPCGPSAFARDSHSPTDSLGSRSSTRSLARFLSLPARHLGHQSQRASGWHSSEKSDDQTAAAATATAAPETKNKRKATAGSFLAELEYHFRCSEPGAAPPALPNKGAAVSQGAQTIARADRISQEQQVRHKRPPKGRPAAGNPDDWEIDWHRLDIGQLIGAGQFGLVFRCRLKSAAGAGEGGPEQTVAVKTLKKQSVEGAREELLAEIEVMKLVCDHPNVVRLLHCCTRDSGPIYLVMELVDKGKLQTFLKESRASHLYATTCGAASAARRAGSPAEPASAGWSSMGYGDAEGDDADEIDGALNEAQAAHHNHHHHHQQQLALLTSRDLIRFIYHVAKGMEYVAANCIVHRDLASRNILVNGQRVCKVGDFGMARHMASEGAVYERRSRSARVPVRWMAPEVLLENSFTTKSDVFSFGILMWEIVTLGSTPYVHLETGQVLEAVARRGERPERPEHCHPLLYSIMASCWQTEPSLRPSFSELARQLDALLLSGEEYIELDQYSDHNYYNIDKTSAPLELL